MELAGSQTLIDTLLFGLSGYIWRLAGITNYGSRGYYWSEQTNGATHQARLLYFNTINSVDVNARDYRGFGFSVRGVLN